MQVKSVIPIATLAGLVFVVFGTAFWQLLDRPIEHFEVGGNLTESEQQQISQALIGQHVSGILSSNLEEIKKSLVHLPWAQQVSVRRVWPDTLALSVTRARPIARWGANAYLSSSGELISLPDDYVGLPQFFVELDEPQQTMNVYRLLDQIFERENLTISRLEQNAHGEWVVQLLHNKQNLPKAQNAQQIELQLGDQQLNQRAHRFLMVYRRVIANHDQLVDYVDARYASGLAVRFKGASTDQPTSDENLGATLITAASIPSLDSPFANPHFVDSPMQGIQ